MFGITPSARLRPSPDYEATLVEGVTAFTTYNHMLMPTGYGHAEVELRGRDAGRLAQILSPRRLGQASRARPVARPARGEFLFRGQAFIDLQAAGQNRGADLVRNLAGKPLGHESLVIDGHAAGRNSLGNTTAR